MSYISKHVFGFFIDIKKLCDALDHGGKNISVGNINDFLNIVIKNINDFYKIIYNNKYTHISKEDKSDEFLVLCQKNYHGIELDDFDLYFCIKDIPGAINMELMHQFTTVNLETIKNKYKLFEFLIFDEPKIITITYDCDCDSEIFFLCETN